MSRFKLLMVFAIILSLAIPSFAKKVKTAECEKGVITDLRLNYTMECPENWKVKTYKEKEDEPQLLRVMMSQKNYRIDQQARDLGGDYTIPEIQVYARPAKMAPMEFLDSLKAAVHIHNSGDELINQLNLILTGEYVDMQEVVIAGENAIQARFKRNWKRELQADPDDPRYRQFGGLIVQDVHDVHEMFIFVHNGWLYVIQGLVEYQFYSEIQEEFRTIVSSMKFADMPETSME